MTTENSNPIIGMKLEGFQVFEQPTYIPLERLTMIFGPNSAGKSAVQDAIELYAVLMGSQSIFEYRNSASLDKLFARHWRRTGGSDDQYVDRMSIAVVHTTQSDIQQTFSVRTGRKVSGNFLARSGIAWELESRWYFEKRENSKAILEYSTCFEFHIESILLVRCSTRELCVNLAHPLVHTIESYVDFAEAAKSYPDDMTLKDGLLTVQGYCLGFDPSGCVGAKDDRSWMKFYADQPATHPSYDESSLFSSAITELSILIGNLLAIANGSTRFRPLNVAASRIVPTRQDLTFQIGDLDDSMHVGPLHESKAYRTLADSLTCELTSYRPRFPTMQEPSTFAKAVNRALTDHLFMEQGYRLDYDFRLLMSEANSRAGLEEGMALDPTEFGFLVEIHLRDAKGRRYLFEDVGSGIGYLLPVLCAVYEKAGSESTCFIQQPELHIHPALQAAMGDVFIEASEEGRQILIETHSEHLLLRVLKRVRQTHLQVAMADELKISADDVCVLYFDPTPEGTTIVKRLRVTEDGEFMDRWPRGFFGERDQELLDE